MNQILCQILVANFWFLRLLRLGFCHFFVYPQRHTYYHESETLLDLKILSK